VSQTWTPPAAPSLDDVYVWYGKHMKCCPTCGIDLSQIDPRVNLTPHYFGHCGIPVEPEDFYPVEDAEQKRWRQENQSAMLWSKWGLRLTGIVLLLITVAVAASLILKALR
jgi:hypothetical protein